MAFLIWRDALWFAHSVLHYLFASPVRMAQTGFQAVKDQQSTETPMSSPIPSPFHDPVIRLPGPNQTSGRDSSSAQSVVSSGGGVAVPIKSLPLRKERGAHISPLRRATLLLIDKADGLPISPKPCHGKRVTPETALTSHWLYQDGLRMASY